MTSKISFFNKGIFRSTVKRYWPAWALYTAFWFLALPVNILSGISGSGEYTAVDFINLLEDMCEEFSVIMTFVFAIIVAMGVFSFMYKSRETSMIASLPVRREAVFTSAFLSGLIPVAVINAVTGILSLLAILGSVNGECVNAVLIWYGSFMLEFITFYGIACFIATITGSLVALPIFYGIFNLFAVSIETLVRSLIEVFVYGVDAWNGTVTEFLSPVVYLSDKTMVYYANSTAIYEHYNSTVCPVLRFESWTTLAIYAVVGIILAVCGLLLYRNRKMECTGDVVAVPKLKPVFKYGVSICSAICFGLLMYLIFWSNNDSLLGVGGFIALVFFMAVGGAIGYFGADMLNKKSTHVFKNNWGGYLAVVIVCVALCVICRFDLFGIGTYVPDAEDVESVRVYGTYDSVVLKDEERIEEIVALHENIAASLNDIAKDSSDRFNSYYEDTVYAVVIEYQLKNGREVSRNYQLSEKRPEAQQYREIMESQAMLEARLAQFESFDEDNVVNSSLSYCVDKSEWYTCELTPAQAIDLYKNAITLDILEGNMDFNGFVIADEYASQIWIEFYNTPDADTDTAVDTGMAYMEFTSFIDSDCVHTIQWFKDNFGADLGGVIHEPIVNESIIESVEIIG